MSEYAVVPDWLTCQLIRDKTENILNYFLLFSHSFVYTLKKSTPNNIEIRIKTSASIVGLSNILYTLVLL